MEPTAALVWCPDIEAFCRQPLGRVARSGPFTVWCCDATLSGLSVPPSADLEQLQALFALLARAPLPGMAPPYDAILDERQLTSLSSAGLGLLMGFLSSFTGRKQPLVRRVVLVAPRDPIMAMVATGFGVASSSLVTSLVPNYRVVPDLRAAFRALDRDDAWASILDSAIASTPAPELAELERWIEANLATVRLDLAAKALCRSERSLQRLLQQSGTSFGELIDRKRIALSQERLLRGDKVEAIAAALGFAALSSFYTFFRRRIGMTPAEFRRERREGERGDRIRGPK